MKELARFNPSEGISHPASGSDLPASPRACSVSIPRKGLVILQANCEGHNLSIEPEFQSLRRD